MIQNQNRFHKNKSSKQFNDNFYYNLSPMMAQPKNTTSLSTLMSPGPAVVELRTRGNSTAKAFDAFKSQI